MKIVNISVLSFQIKLFFIWKYNFMPLFFPCHVVPSKKQSLRFSNPIKWWLFLIFKRLRWSTFWIPRFTVDILALTPVFSLIFTAEFWKFESLRIITLLSVNVPGYLFAHIRVNEVFWQNVYDSLVVFGPLNNV